MQNGLPDRKLLAKVWNRTSTPVNAAVSVVIVETLFGLLSLASSVAVGNLITRSSSIILFSCSE